MSRATEVKTPKSPKEGTGDGTGAASLDKDTGNGMGKDTGKDSPTPTISNSKGIPDGARPLNEHGGWYIPGNPGHDGSNAGRPKKLTREALTEAAGEAHEPYVKLRNDWLDKAQKELDKGNIDAADRCQKAADRIQEGYLKYGLGSKVTNVVENDQVLDVFAQALDRAQVPIEQQVQVMDEVRAWMKPQA